MNTTTTATQEKPAPQRVRARDGVEGVIIDITDDGWVFWFGDDLSCHVSKPDFLEVVQP